MAERPPPSDKSILRKLLLKPGQRATVLNAPASYESVAQQIPGVHKQLDGTFDFIHVFATSAMSCCVRVQSGGRRCQLMACCG